ncbi:MAG: sulfotransferase [Actinomycetota bacterium]|nr:sulfotransferase [Actinomycetota bacterium]MDQ6948152.1 sulfotransferase [Actinomycetota bacterium]
MTAEVAPPERLTVPGLLEEATTASGLTAWGDQGFVATLDRLLESCRETAGLTPAGWAVLRKVALRHLRNRLYLQAYLSTHGDVARTPIGPPVVITGLPRTGTTLLHNLLALDPANRVLRFWEALHPVPTDPARAPGQSRPIGLPVGAATGGPHEREKLVAQASTWLERLYSLTPDFRSIHSLTAEGPEECDALLQNSFASQHFDDMFQAESYSAWLNRADLKEEYAYYAQQLQTLTGPHERELTWVLKSPGHLGYLDTVAAIFPGCLIVHCHRDPVEALASYASLVMAVRSPHTDRTSPLDIGTHVVNRCAIAMARALQARDSLGNDRFADIGYPALVSDPLPAVRGLYARLGRSLSGTAEAAMTRWLAENPQHKHGRHRYTLSTFGLSSSQVAVSLGDYGERFAVEIGRGTNGQFRDGR